MNYTILRVELIALIEWLVTVTLHLLQQNQKQKWHGLPKQNKTKQKDGRKGYNVNNNNTIRKGHITIVL